LTTAMRGPSSTGKRLTSLPVDLISHDWCSSLCSVPGQAGTSHVSIGNVPAQRWTAISVPCGTAGGRPVRNPGGGRPSPESNSSTAAGSDAADPHPGRTPRTCFGGLLPRISFGLVASCEPRRPRRGRPPHRLTTLGRQRELVALRIRRLASADRSTTATPRGRAYSFSGAPGRSMVDRSADAGAALDKGPSGRRTIRFRRIARAPRSFGARAPVESGPARLLGGM